MGKASDAVADITSLTAHIKPTSVVLPLDFAPEGRDAEHKAIADANFIFCHATHYLAGDKPLIFLDNYEANTGYFPLVWKENVNPYNPAIKCGPGFEAPVPCANIVGYERATGVKIDYLILWCFKPSLLQDPGYQYTAAQVQNGYHLIFTSPSGRSLLYERNIP